MKRRTAEQQKLADNAKLLRIWRKFHADEKAQVLAGPHGAALAELFRMFENLQHLRPSQLIGTVASVDWAVIDSNTRLVTLHELNTAITRYRVRRGLEPIDDSLPGQPDTPSRAIKAIIFPHVADVAPTEAQLGSDIKRLVKQGTTS